MQNNAAQNKIHWFWKMQTCIDIGNLVQEEMQNEHLTLAQLFSNTKISKNGIIATHLNDFIFT